MTRIIAINGPPRSGKDVLARYIRSHVHPDTATVIILSLADPLYRMLDLDYIYDKSLDEIKQEEKTFRPLITKFAEEIIKPNFGQDFFVRKLVNDIKSRTNKVDFVIVPDLGFQIEYDILAENFHVDVISLSREGCSFDGDSRSYVEASPVIKIKTTDYAEAGRNAHYIASTFINYKRWRKDE